MNTNRFCASYLFHNGGARGASVCPNRQHTAASAGCSSRRLQQPQGFRRRRRRTLGSCCSTQPFQCTSRLRCGSGSFPVPEICPPALLLPVQPFNTSASLTLTPAPVVMKACAPDRWNPSRSAAWRQDGAMIDDEVSQRLSSNVGAEDQELGEDGCLSCVLCLAAAFVRAARCAQTLEFSPHFFRPSKVWTTTSSKIRCVGDFLWSGSILLALKLCSFGEGTATAKPIAWPPSAGNKCKSSSKPRVNYSSMGACCVWCDGKIGLTTDGQPAGSGTTRLCLRTAAGPARFCIQRNPLPKVIPVTCRRAAVPWSLTRLHLFHCAINS